MDGNSCKLWAVLNVHGADVCTWVPQSETDLSGSTLSLSHHITEASLSTELNINICLTFFALQLKKNPSKSYSNNHCRDLLYNIRFPLSISCLPRINWLSLYYIATLSLCLISVFWQQKMLKKTRVMKCFPNHFWAHCFNLYHQARLALRHED